ncbi:hypothetical protein L13192_06516 [Pyrenophora tritici-repentis]|uniref:Uncharacterized protein n=1 Tax=Pyrenophora tritici-repentis TaxID=45151 RepID=A0A922N9J6_9PLEO|nr:hypothetical protein Ptr86124_008987 [Pyrenophora tritici-repentis]KAI1669057.1 hypothetical protein L13192_06516 [Pyrenophora tritici-repentis]KAI1684269.1 hypothetical protein KJE20_06774 [Pyrenophora tritici-repentis]
MSDTETLVGESVSPINICISDELLEELDITVEFTADGRVMHITRLQRHIPDYGSDLHSMDYYTSPKITSTVPPLLDGW